MKKPLYTQLFRLPTLLRTFAVASAIVFCVYTLRWIDRPTYGFAMYYTYSRMVLDGEDFSRAYDFEYFNAKIHEYGINTIDMPNNLPTAALPMLPFAWLSPSTAKTIWTLISIGLFIASLRILFGVFRISPGSTTGLALILLSFAFRPVYDGIALGQMYFLILFLFSLSVLAISRSQSVQAAFPIDLAFAFKGYGLVPMVWLGVHKCWKTLLVVLCIAAGIFAFTIPFFKLEAWRVYYESVVVHFGSRPSDAHVAYQTINGFFRHLFSFDPKWLPYPVVQLPVLLVTVLAYAANLLFVFFILKDSPDSGNHRSLSFSAAIATGVITAPLAEEYHFILFLPLIVGLTKFIAIDKTRLFPVKANEVLFGVASLILALPLKYKSLEAASFPLILLAYPKLYAGVTMLYCYKRICRDTEIHKPSVIASQHKDIAHD